MQAFKMAISNFVASSRPLLIQQLARLPQSRDTKVSKLRMEDCEMGKWIWIRFVSISFSLTFLAVLVFAPVANAQHPGDTIMDLGPVSAPALAGPMWFGMWTLGINAAGDVVGASPSGAGNVHAALFRNGSISAR